MTSTTTTFFDLIRPHLPEVEARMRSGGPHHPDLEAALDHLLASGGKRLRPTLALLTGMMLGAERSRLITLAAAIEMLHTATLVHDDLIDGSLMRRGSPTLNARWTPGATVLTGDYVFARAAQLAAQTGSLPLMENFARTLMTIVSGEITQLFGSNRHPDRNEYFRRIYAKTASLFELAAEAPAMLSSSPTEVVASMKAFGYNVGMAFQIADDVLDFIASPEAFGKPVASDLRQGLITLPALCYLEQQPEDQRLQRLLAGGQLDEAAVSGLAEAIRRSGAIDQALDEAREYVRAGERALEAMPATPEREGLYQLAEYVVQRNL